METLDQILSMMQLEHESIRDWMLKAQARAKTYWNKKKREDGKNKHSDIKTSNRVWFSGIL